MTTRRGFLQGAAAVAAAQAAHGAPKPLRLGVIAHGNDIDAMIARVKELGFTNCQVHLREYSDENAAKLKAALQKYGIEATAVIVTGPGPEVYDFQRGPLTIGLVVKQYRAERIAHMKKASDFCKTVGISGVQGHCGFIPENPNDPAWGEVVEALKEVGGYVKKNGQTFRCETGQETPVTLVRTLKATGLDNVGVNLDPANLLMYGKANPVDALELLGPYVLGVHAKDGLYPTEPDKLGREVAIGQGKVDFPRFIAKLKAVGYKGPITIEREISGPKQTEDILASKKFLEGLIG